MRHLRENAVVPESRPESPHRRTRGAVTVLNLEVVYTPAPASQIAIMEDSLQLLAVWAVRAARAGSDSSSLVAETERESTSKDVTNANG